MDEPFKLILVPAPDESAGENLDKMVERAFLTAAGPGYGSALSAEPFATILPPALAFLGGWLHARYGRKVRLKVGDIEVEAQTPEEVEKLFDKAQELQERDEPRKVLS